MTGCLWLQGWVGAHPALVHPILQVVRSSTGALLAMGKGNSGHNQDPPEAPSPAPVLFSAGEGQPWTEVEVGLARIIALYHRSSTLYQIR